MSAHAPRQTSSKAGTLKQFLGVFQYSREAARLVWTTNKRLTIAFAILTLFAGILPAVAAWVGKLIVDAVVAGQLSGSYDDALQYVAIEAGIVVALAAVRKGIDVCQSLLRVQLGYRVNVLILEKALTLDLAQFEDSEFYDKLTRARRQASSRPLSLVNRTFGLVRNGISLVSYAGLLFAFSPWAVLLVAAAGIPAFFVETRFSGEAFRLFQWRSQETRQQHYLEVVLAREDYVKEVQLFGLGPRLLERYKDIFSTLYEEDRSLTLRRGFWGYLLGLLSTAAFYGAYLWIVLETVSGTITLGEMTMYLMIFKQSQDAFSSSLSSIGGMYEDNLYLSNLYEYLDQGTPERSGTATEGPAPGDGVRFESVEFTYPGAESAALRGINLHLAPGQKLALVGENGSGKTTLIKLLTRLYEPTAGRILLDGLDIRDWEIDALRRRVGVIFQDFVRYQFKVGENIGVGDEDHFEDEERWRESADKGMATPFIEPMDEGFHTQLGRWFKGGRELSGGQWQKIALSRAFMRRNADILVLDEPTSAMDAEAEAQIFDRFREMTQDQMAVLISHRFSTVRMADQIAVLDQGRIIEHGSHEELMHHNGQYAHLFTLQAAGYQ